MIPLPHPMTLANGKCDMTITTVTSGATNVATWGEIWEARVELTGIRASKQMAGFRAKIRKRPIS